MSDYHAVHYGLFHVMLPQVLRDGMIVRLANEASAGNGELFMLAVWSTMAAGNAEEPPKELQLSEEDFGVELLGSESMSMIVIKTPQVRAPLEAGLVGIVFEDDDPAGTMRYFTCEAPMSDDAPWMIGEVKPDGRANLGMIVDVSPQGFVQRIVSILGGQSDAQGDAPVPSTRIGSQPGNGVSRPAAGRPIPPGPGVREIPDVDELVKGRESGKAPARPSTKIGQPRDNSSGPAESPAWGGNKDTKIGGGPTKVPTGDTSIPAPPGPVLFHQKWGSSVHELATEAVTNLYRIRSAGGSVLVMTAKKTKGLAKVTSSYVQFMWVENDDLVVEIQGDYSYWGVAVPSQWWPTFESAGLAVPGSANGNFNLRIPGSVTPEQRLGQIAKVIGVFVSVIKPTGRLATQIF